MPPGALGRATTVRQQCDNRAGRRTGTPSTMPTADRASTAVLARIRDERSKVNRGANQRRAERTAPAGEPGAGLRPEERLKRRQQGLKAICLRSENRKHPSAGGTGCKPANPVQWRISQEPDNKGLRLTPSPVLCEPGSALDGATRRRCVTPTWQAEGPNDWKASIKPLHTFPPTKKKV